MDKDIEQGDVVEQMTWRDLLPVLTADEATSEADGEWEKGYQEAARKWNSPDWDKD